MEQRELADRYAALRENEGLRQKEFAKKLNISHKTVSFYENGTRSMTVNHLIKYADHFDVSIDYLLGRTNDQTTDANLQAICSYTGLSQKSVEILNGFSCRKQNEKVVARLLDTVNALIESEDEQHYFLAALEIISAMLFTDAESGSTIAFITQNGKISLAEKRSYDAGTEPVLYAATLRETLYKSMGNELLFTINYLRMAVNPNESKEREKKLHEILKSAVPSLQKHSRGGAEHGEH